MVWPMSNSLESMVATSLPIWNQLTENPLVVPMRMKLALDWLATMVRINGLVARHITKTSETIAGRTFAEVSEE